MVRKGVHEMVKGCMLVKVLSGFYFDRNHGKTVVVVHQEFHFPFLLVVIVEQWETMCG